jgi:hypothetical protein
MSKRGKIAVSFLFVLLLIVLIVMGNLFIGYRNIQKVQINVVYGKSDTIIRANEIEKSLTLQYGNLLSKRKKDIDERTMEAFLKNNPYIEDAQVYQTLSGDLKIDIKQGEPVIRLCTKEGQEYYIDRQGKIMPIVSTMQTTDVVVANGDISISRQLLAKQRIDTSNAVNKFRPERNIIYLYELANMIYSDSILAYQIDQIFVSQIGNYELIPKIGSCVIRVGTMTDMSEQLRKLGYLYKEGFSRVGWDNYSAIDLRYKNQAVCTRKPGVQAPTEAPAPSGVE